MKKGPLLAYRSFIIGSVVIYLAVSSFYLAFEWNRHKIQTSSNAIILARSVASGFSTDSIISLSGSTQDLVKPGYNFIKQELIRLIHDIDEIHFAYLLAQRGDSLIFLVDSEMPDSPDYAPPGLVFTEAADVYRKPFRTGEIALTNPTKDRWGTWVSVLVPIKEPITGAVIALFGIDFPVKEWYRQLGQRFLTDIFVVTIFLIFTLLLIWSQTQKVKLKKLSDKAAKDEALYRGIFEQAPIGIAIVKDKAFISRSEFSQMNMNPMMEKILNRTNSEIEYLSWVDITHPDDLPADLEKFEQFQAGAINGYSMEKRFLRPDGSSVWVDMKVSPLLGGSSIEKIHLCLLENISEKKAIAEALRVSERDKAIIFAHLPGLVYRCKYDRDWTMVFLSDGCRELTGYQAESLLGNRDISFNEIIPPEYRETLWNEWKLRLFKRMPFRFEYEIITANGERKWVLELAQGVYKENGEVEALEGIMLDISDKKRMENTLKYSSDHDLWSGLYNRKYLHEVFAADQKAGRFKRRALIGINISSIFKLNLLYGYSYGQELIRKVAEALSENCNPKCEVFYIFENWFVIYGKGYDSQEQLLKICSAAARTIESVLRKERISVGIGVVEIKPDDTVDLEVQLKRLLIASEKNMYTPTTDIVIDFFTSAMQERLDREEALSHELVQVAAGENVDKLFLHYQPIFDLKSDKIIGFEALARFESEQFGGVSPLEFIPLAEKTKTITGLGDLVIYRAFDFLKNLETHGHHSTTIAINISALQLLREGFINRLDEQIKQKSINPKTIVLEITESVFASDFNEINRLLLALKEIGIKIAIDDFGTGYSSLARERDLNIDGLKIDKSFIDRLLEINTATAITTDIISMAHKLGHYVVAEGVEEQMQLEYLKQHGCDMIQGYLISKPVSEEEALKLLER
ncbi:EAL domain-containing protein [bacterium]|nr:EAL domain-containing protein [bacterium]